MRNWLGVSVLLLTTSFVPAEHGSRPVRPRDRILYRDWLWELQSPDEAYIYGATNLPSGAVLTVMCDDFIGQGSHIVSKDTTVTVAQKGLFHVSVAPKQSHEFKSNMICSVAFHASNQPAAVLKITGRQGERLGKVTTNSQVGIYSGGQYLEAVTVLHS